MQKTNVFEPFFDNRAHEYAPLTRYSPEVLDTAIENFLRYLPKESTSVLDVGAGDGYPASRLIDKLPELQLSLLDISPEMLNAANHRLEKYNPTLIRGDLNQIKLEPDSFDGILSCCTLQFVKELSPFFGKLRSALIPNGILCLLFYDPDDLQRQLVHRFFPGFHAIERSRHYFSNEVIQALRIMKISILHSEYRDYNIFYFGVTDYLNFIASRPFSGFALMADDHFDNNFRVFCKEIHELFSCGSVNCPGRIRLIIARR